MQGDTCRDDDKVCYKRKRKKMYFLSDTTKTEKHSFYFDFIHTCENMRESDI